MDNSSCLLVVNECKNCWESDKNKFWCKICQGGFCSEKCHKEYEESFYSTEYSSPHQWYNKQSGDSVE